MVLFAEISESHARPIFVMLHEQISADMADEPSGCGAENADTVAEQSASQHSWLLSSVTVSRL